MLSAGAAIMGNSGMTLLSSGTDIAISALDKIGFDLDTTGRQPEIQRLVEEINLEYENQGWKVNVAVWNMHLDERHDFNDIVYTGLSKMGNGGGFRVVAFIGSGWITNRVDGGVHNWRCTGNKSQNGNTIKFEAHGGPE